MSLKDRFNSIQKQAISKPEETKAPEIQPKKEVVIDSLGVLENLLIDDELNNIFVNGAKNIYTEKFGKISKSNLFFKDDKQLEDTIKSVAKSKNIAFDELNPFFKFNYKQGINITGTLSPLCDTPVLHIKNYVEKHATILSLQEDLCISKEIALVLEALCSIDKNILITGDKSSLKTTLLSSLTKKIPSNNRVSVIDSENELGFKLPNCTSYDFSKMDDGLLCENVLNFILSTIPDKLIINTNDEELLSRIINVLDNQKGIIANTQANSPLKAVEKLTQNLMDINPYLNKQEAKAKILDTFDIIIHTQKDENGRRKITSISEFNPLSENEIQDIFNIDYSNQHKSTGITPRFYEAIKGNSLPISTNIFDINYNHTYYKTINLNNINQLERKTSKLDILKKFKKDLSAPIPLEEKAENIQENKTQEEIEEAKKLVEFAIEIQENDNLSENQNEILWKFNAWMFWIV